jgi:hypothetical protein
MDKLMLQANITRRTLLAGALTAGAAPVAANQYPTSPTRPEPPGVAPEHTFREVYNRWIDLRAEGAKHPGTISSKELKAWHEVKAAWRALAHYEDNEVY